jgi:prolyl-tRNA editing enzyme YbaK/EbsC (Cys-tRNA(Pro) deacylase)
MSSSVAGPRLDWRPAAESSALVGPAAAAFLASWPQANQVQVAAIDPSLADTVAFCESYDVPLAESANCVVVAGKRAGEVRYAACLVLAIDRADVNGVVRRLLDVRKVSFLAMDDAVGLTGMEYGGITALGLPSGWRILLDEAVVDASSVVVGSGVRSSKLRLPGAALLELPGAQRIARLALQRGSAD